jgi:biopolymer transport protein ExbB/TolQ
MKRGVWTLNALGWSVPLLSLFLSVSGVILCLKGMKAAEGAGIAAIAGGLAESLWPTAFAMLATIPIVWSQKYFGLKVGTFLLEMDRLSLALTEEIVDRHRSILLKTPTSTQSVTQELHLRPTLKLAFDNQPSFRHHAAP